MRSTVPDRIQYQQRVDNFSIFKKHPHVSSHCPSFRLSPQLTQIYRHIASCQLPDPMKCFPDWETGSGRKVVFPQSHSGQWQSQGLGHSPGENRGMRPSLLLCPMLAHTLACSAHRHPGWGAGSPFVTIDETECQGLEGTFR